MAEDGFGIVGSTLAGSYQVEAVVAEGGFGVVYRAFHTSFKAPVALKCLKIPREMKERHRALFLDRFREEAALLFRLSASLPAVVRPLQIDTATGPDGRLIPFMALEWLDGHGLDRVLERRRERGRGPLGLAAVTRLLRPVARVLARAHRFPTPDGPIAIVHRDIKPENIFLSVVNGQRAVKLFDFGIATVRGVAGQGGPETPGSQGLLAFTPGYGAPEQWSPDRFGPTGPATDVWGLALTSIEAATGRAIIDGSTDAMRAAACDPRHRPTPRSQGLVVDDAVEAVFARALAVDPRERFEDAGAFWDALENALGVAALAPLDASDVVDSFDDALRSAQTPGDGVKVVVVEPPPVEGPLRPSVAGELRRTGKHQLGGADVVLRRTGKGQFHLSSDAPVSVSDRMLAGAGPLSSTGKGQLSRTGRFGAGPVNPAVVELSADEAAKALSIATVEAVPLSKKPGRAAGAAPPGDDVLGLVPSVAKGGASRVVGETGVVAARGASLAAPAPENKSPTRVSGIYRTPEARAHTRALVTLSVGACGLLLLLADQVYARTTGALLSVGPLRVTWLAGVLTLGALAELVRRLFVPRT